MKVFSLRIALLFVAFSLLIAVVVSAQKAKTRIANVVRAPSMDLQAQLKLVQAEDELLWVSLVEQLLHSLSPEIRKRAALAAGRIGDEASVPALSVMLENDSDSDVRAMAAFALGETEAAKA